MLVGVRCAVPSPPQPAAPATLPGLIATVVLTPQTPTPPTPPALITTDHNLRFDSKSQDDLVVLGWSSPGSVWFYPGFDDGMNWHCTRGTANARRLQPEGGFIVARLPARTGKATYAIGMVSSSGNVQVQGPLPNGPVWVFNAEPGKVSYLGALRVDHLSDRGPVILADERFKQSEADDFVTQTFPNIPIHVTTGQLDSAYMFDSCY